MSEGSSPSDRVAPHAEARAILETTDLCSFNWNSQDGWPMGTTVAFQWIDDQIWFSMDKAEARVRAIRRDPRVAIVMRGPGKSLTIKGRAVFTDDVDQRRLVYQTTAKKVERLTEGATGADSYAKHLEKKGSVVFEMVPEKWIAYDGSDGSVSTSPPAAMTPPGTG